MKRIKRIITVRKVEFIINSKHDHELNLEKCPLCHSPIHVLAAQDLAIDHLAADLPHQLTGKSEIVIKGDQND